MARDIKTIRVYEVLADGEAEGPAGDGTHVNRFRNRSDAVCFAAGATCYGQDATVHTVDVPLHIARRWWIA